VIAHFGLGDTHMRRFLYALIGALALLGWYFPASGADLPTKAPIPYTPASYSWSGLYFGLQGGGDIAAIPLSNLSPGPATTGAPAAAFGDPGVFGAGANGFLGGAHVGFNIPFTSAFVAGIEVGAQATGLASNQNVTMVNGGVGLTASSAFNLVWDGYADAKLGWLLSRNVYLYGIGGLSFGEIKDTASLSMGAANTTLTANDIRTGWNIGTGVDYCPDPKFCVGTRYRYVSYGSKSLGAFTDPAQTVVFAPNRPSAFNEFTLRAWIPLY
jgi:outer membrane immunogenic protein